jgi:large subunit ribosomal protein L15
MEKENAKKSAPQKAPAKKAPAKKVAAPAAPVVAAPKYGLHSVKPPKGAHKKHKLLGRGSSSGHGKTSTRGSKGQTSRAGRHMYAGFEGGQSPLIRRMPKRGFTSKFAIEYQVVNVESLGALTATAVNPAVLHEKGIIKSLNRPVKILGEGEITKAMTVSAHAFSKSAAEKIKQAGGTVEVITHA